jgi:hypothetical protein
MTASRALILSLFVVVAALAAADPGPARDAPVPPPPTEAGLLASLANAPEGWQVAEPPVAFHADDLWKWIDGEATQILEYQLQFAVKSAYSNGKTRVEVGVFIAKTQLDAFGIFSRQRTPSSKTAQLINASFFDGTQLHVWRNYAYLRLLPDKTDLSVRQSIRELAEGLCSALEPAPRLPGLLSLLPVEGIVPGTLAYYRTNALGSADLGNAIKADYSAAGKPVAVWLFDGGDAAAAGKAMATLAGLLGKQRAVRDLGDEAFRGSADPYGPTLVMRQGQYVAAVLPAVPPEIAQALLRRLSVSIEVHEAGGECGTGNAL